MLFCAYQLEDEMLGPSYDCCIWFPVAKDCVNNELQCTCIIIPDIYTSHTCLPLGCIINRPLCLCVPPGFAV